MIILHTYDKRLYTENGSRLTDWNDDEKKTWLHLENTCNKYLQSLLSYCSHKSADFDYVYMELCLCFLGPEVMGVKPDLSKGRNFAVD